MARKKEEKAPEIKEPTPPKTGNKTIKITDNSELMKIQDEGRLIGWNPVTKEAVIKEG